MKNLLLLTRNFLLLTFVSSILSLNVWANGFFLEPIKERNFAISKQKYDNKKEYDKQRNQRNQFQSDELPRKYNVLNYDLYVDWVGILLSEKNEPDKRKWQGKIKIKLTPIENNLSLIELDAVELQINEIFINDIELENIPAISNGILAIPLNNPININDTVTLNIHYEYNNPLNRGFCHRNTGYYTMPSQTEGISVASTMSEPSDARYWFPCNDRPDDKAIVSITVKVPVGFKAASNGILDSIVQIDETDNDKDNVPAEIYYWSSIEPISSYLMAISASTYSLKNFWIKKNSTVNPNATKNDSVEIQYYIWEEDWEGNQNIYNAQKALNQTEKTMHIFSDIFGDYAFSKYGVAITDYSLLGYAGLGMEHQTITTVTRNWLRNNNPAYSSFAHELAHHWFGNLVTCKTWKDIWFQEGGASWSESIYREFFYNDKPSYYINQYSHKQFYLDQCDKKPYIFITPIYDLNADEVFDDYSEIAYSKASWVYHQLREMLGDDIFFPLIKKLFDEFRFDNISTEQFINFFIENIDSLKLELPNFEPPMDLSIYFRQWIYKAGHPIYSIISECQKINDNDNEKYNVTVNIEQIQIEKIQDNEIVPNVFVMPLELEFYQNKKKIFTKNILNNELKQTFNFEFDNLCDSVSINSDKALFEIKSNDHLEIDDNNEMASFIKLIYPNPLRNGNLFIELQNNFNMPLNIKIFDIFGIELNAKCEIKMINDKLILINVDLLNNGIYFVNLNSNKLSKLIIFRE